VKRLTFLIGLGLAATAAWPISGGAQDGAVDAPAPEVGVAIFGERLMHHRLYPEGGGSARFDPPLPADDKAMLLAAMKALTRAVYGVHGISLDDPEAFNPRIGAITRLEDFDYDYRFMLDGSEQLGVRVILVQRKEAERTIDEELLLKELEAL
jgi:hypothetical protein